jgi:hypothetical protein
MRSGVHLLPSSDVVVPDEQGFPEPRFERANLMADRAMGDAQFGGCAAEAAVIGSRFKALKRTKGREAPHIQLKKYLRRLCINFNAMSRGVAIN